MTMMNYFLAITVSVMNALMLAMAVHRLTAYWEADRLNTTRQKCYAAIAILATVAVASHSASLVSRHHKAMGFFDRAIAVTEQYEQIFANTE